MSETVITHAEEPGNPDLIAALRDEIRVSGPITFARFMDQALYHPEFGYYMSPTRRPGRGGDFITAPELHPFFGLTIARQIVECWDRLGNPSPFTVLEYGSGIGGLAYDVIVGMLEARPELRTALRYRLGEINPHRTVQALAAMDEVGLGQIVDVDTGAEPFVGVVLANEVADAMPVHRLRWSGAEFEEIQVAWDDARGFVEQAAPLSPEVIAFDPQGYLVEAGLDLGVLPVGARIEVSPAIEQWIAGIADRIERGYALIIDYGYPTTELYAEHRLEGTVRAYGSHKVTDNPYQAAGERDLTAHVDFTRMIRAGETHGLSVAGLATQSEFLANAGLGDLLLQMQGDPETSIEEYYRAQAAVFRLIDPGGMGRFRVLGLAREASIGPPLRGFAGPDLPKALRI